MRRGIAWVTVGALAAWPAQGTSTAKVYVDCEAAVPGDGSWAAPYDSITAALPEAAELSAYGPVAVAIDEGICADEVFPIRLDFPVHVYGARKPDFDARGYPLGTQSRDTLVSAGTVPANTPLFLLEGDGVRLSSLSIDGNVDPGPDGSPEVPPRPGPVGVLATGTFRVEFVRVFEAFLGIRVTGGSGVIANNHVDRVTNGIGLSGSDEPNRVVATNNRVGYRLNGMPMGGGGPDGTTAWTTELRVVRNDLFTTYTNTGPTHPVAMPVSPFLSGRKDGELRAVIAGNQIRGTPKHDYVLHEIASGRGAGPYTGAMDLTFFGNRVDATAEASATPLITFTSALGTVWTCQLTLPGHPGCPPGPRVEYLQGALYEVSHGGELDEAMIDHPAVDPGDGDVLDNLLVINGEVIPNQTFVVIP